MRVKNEYDNLLNIIDDFIKPKEGKLIKSNSQLNNSKAILEPYGKSLSVTFEWNRFSKEEKNLNIGQSYKKVLFELKDKTYVFENIFLGTFLPPKIKGTVSFMYSKGFSKKKKFYYRLVIPLEIELKFHYSLSTNNAKINHDTLQFKVINNLENKSFLVIESKTKQSYELFSDKTFALKNAIGYLTGHLAGNQGYFFAYTRQKMETAKHLYRCEFRDSIISSYSPIYSNPYGYIRNRKLADKYYKNNLLRPINISELSTLCQRLYDSVELSSAIILILESSVSSLLFMPGGYAIALETLANIIKPDKKQKVAPMKPAVSKKVRKECSEVIDKYKEELSKDSYQALLDRIGWFNQATNKAKLRAPFDYLKIDLLDEDLAILQARNDFLHGRVPDMTNAGKDRSLERQNKDLYYASVRFYTLLNMLILKWIGYNNKTVNYPKINEDYTKIKLKEEPYRQV
jgi:hypothetical protein